MKHKSKKLGQQPGCSTSAARQRHGADAAAAAGRQTPRAGRHAAARNKNCRAPQTLPFTLALLHAPVGGAPVPLPPSASALYRQMVALCDILLIVSSSLSTLIACASAP
jgi:hypothetical protein